MVSHLAPKERQPIAQGAAQPVLCTWANEIAAPTAWQPKAFLAQTTPSMWLPSFQGYGCG
jgi:hypothetical protein